MTPQPHDIERRLREGDSEIVFDADYVRETPQE